MLFKRLRLIRELIAESSIPEAESELDALGKTASDVQLVESIRNCLHQNPLNAIAFIDDYLKSNTQPLAQTELEIAGMRTEIKLLETRLSVLQGRKADISKTINRFRIRHNHELGMIMSELLRLRWEKALRDFGGENDEKANKAEEDYKRYQQSRKHFSEQKSVPKLNKKDKEKIKQLFREASKICHPDMVAEEMQQQAEKVFHELNNAYFYNDIARIEEIYKMLKSGNLDFGRRDIQLNEKQRLKNYLTKLKADIYSVQAETGEIENAPVWLSIQRIDDWDVYFAGLKEKFTMECESLKAELHEQ